MSLTPDISSILNAREKRLNPSYSYKLSDVGSYGLDVAVLNGMDIDTEEMSVVIPFADGSRRDGVGDLLEVAGINTERHRMNPICLFDHGKQITLPIGLAEDPRTKQYTVSIDPVAKTARCKCFFYQSSKDKEHGLFCEQLFDLMAKRFVRAGSIGYQVIHAREIGPDYDRGVPKGLHLLSTLMLEASAVVMPANMDTVRKTLSMPRICGKPLSPMLVKSLTPYLGEKKHTVTSGYMAGGRQQTRCNATVPTALLEYFSPLPVLTKSTNDTISELKKVCETFKDIPDLGPDYQTLMWNEQDKHAWWISFDGDSEEGVQEVKRRLEKVPGVSKVTVESEYGPSSSKEGWVKIQSNVSGKSIRSLYQRKRLITKKKSFPSVTEVKKCLEKEGITVLTVTQVAGSQTLKVIVDRTQVVFARQVIQQSGYTDLQVVVEGGDKSMNIKDLRSLYSRKSLDQKAIVSSGNVMDFYAGGTVVARNHLFHLVGGKTTPFAKPGERLKVVEVEPNGMVKVRRADGTIASFSSAEVRKTKGLEDGSKAIDLWTLGPLKVIVEDGRVIHSDTPYCEVGKKPNLDFLKRAGWNRKKNPPKLDAWGNDVNSPHRGKDLGKEKPGFKDIRAKYRRTKGFRRTLKKGVAGSSMVYVRNKDLENVKKFAAERGLDCKYIGSKNGLEKVRLTGDEKAMDDVARQFGRPTKSFRRG